MPLSKDQVEELIKVIKLHTDWFVVSLLGPQAVTSDDLAELQAYGTLPLNFDINMVENAYVLGVLQSLLKKQAWKELSYDALLLEAKRTHTPLEELAIHQASLSAGAHLKKLATDIAQGAFSDLASAIDDVVTDATIKEMVRDRTQIARKERKTYQAFASDLANELQTDWRRDWRRVAETELHGAKVRGHVASIIAKKDVYAGTEGASSRVSVIRAPDACEDCHHHYDDENGEPKIFLLTELLSAGSNGDDGVDHRRKGGLHAFWKTTLPPLHPRCGCNVTYIPPGFGWKDRKLVIVDEKAYKEYLFKSQELRKAEGYTPFNSTAKPMGPKDAKPDEPAPPSLPNVPSPGNVPGPGKPPSAGAGKPAGPQQQMVPCIFGGGEECIANGGDGADNHRADSQVVVEHQKRAGQGMVQAQPVPVDPVQLQQATKEWSKAPTKRAVAEQHLTHGEFGTMEEIGSKGETQMSEVHKVSIIGNGDAAFKPHNPEEENYREGIIPSGTSHKREVAADQIGSLLGHDLIPPTVLRDHQGKTGSLQAWKHDATPMGAPENISDSADEKSKPNSVKTILNKHPHLQEDLSRLVVTDIVMNNTDRHDDNILVHNDGEGVTGIDHGMAFGNGMDSYRNQIHSGMHRAGYKVKIPEDMQTRMKNSTYGDYKRSLGPHVEDWAVAQSFLRSQYALHLQDTEGHLDYNHFVHSMNLPNGGMGSDDDVALVVKQHTSEEGTTAERFDAFARTWLSQASRDPSHQHHAAAKEIKDLNPFLPPAQISNKKLRNSSQESRSIRTSQALAKTPVQVPKTAKPLPKTAKAGA